MRFRFKGWLALVWAFLLTAPPAMVWAQKTVPNHPIVKPMPEVSKQEEAKYKRFDAHTFPIRVGEERGKKEVRGEYWYFFYQTKAEISPLEIIENYKQAALEKNGRIVFDEDKELVFTLDLPDGVTLWAHVNPNGWDRNYELYLIEEKPLKKTLTFGAAQIQHELETKGEVTIYGINFDFDKATLRPGSEKVLLEVLKVLKSRPEMKVEVQGHTCSLGGREYNLKLSQARAETVKNFLVQHGIEESRLNPKGYGLELPVASNDTEAGRAQNRRVVFKKI